MGPQGFLGCSQQGMGSRTGQRFLTEETRPCGRKDQSGVTPEGFGDLPGTTSAGAVLLHTAWLVPTKHTSQTHQEPAEFSFPALLVELGTGELSRPGLLRHIWNPSHS